MRKSGLAFVSTAERRPHHLPHHAGQREFVQPIERRPDEVFGAARRFRDQQIELQREVGEDMADPGGMRPPLGLIGALRFASAAVQALARHRLRGFPSCRRAALHRGGATAQPFAPRGDRKPEGDAVAGGAQGLGQAAGRSSATPALKARNRGARDRARISASAACRSWRRGP